MHSTFPSRALSLLLVASFLVLACQAAEKAPPPDADPSAATDVADHGGATHDAVPREPLKEAFFGDLHIHSSWSLDAFAFQVRVGPEDAYRYARGEAIDHVSGQPIQLQGPPLDFMGLTEHANYLGVPSAAAAPDDPLREIPLLRDLRSEDPAVVGAAMARTLAALSSDTRIPELPAGGELARSTWSELVELADRHYLPGEFTTFVAYEYISMPDGQNLHRNVIFRGTDVPARPFSSFDSQDPADLWAWMEKARETGSDVIAIPHNGNGSNGLMYDVVDRSGRPIDAAHAALRMRNEPVSEVMQIKGQSETHPLLSPNDEWASFSILGTILGRPEDSSRPEGSYVRRALAVGLEMEEREGFNPYRIGMIGASDGHNAAAPVEESNFTGKIGVLDGTPEARLVPPTGEDGIVETGAATPGLRFSAAGLAGVWAEANTREDLFDALRAKEVFATSGPRIRVRLFGGWQLGPSDLGAGLVEGGYAGGVPMGGELRLPAGGSGDVEAAPTFLVHASRDPNEATLERLQIVKAWVEGGEALEQIFGRGLCRGRRARHEDRALSDRVAGAGSRELRRRCDARSRGARGGLDGPRIRRGAACLLLRARAADPHLPLEHLARRTNSESRRPRTFRRGSRSGP